MRAGSSKSPIVGLLTAIPDIELPAMLRSFGIAVDKPADEEDAGERYWLSEVTTKDGPIRVVMSCTRSSGNVAASLAANMMIAKFRPEAMFFVGIACGLRTYALADVVTSETIWAYEYAKTTNSDDRDRSRTLSTPSQFVTDVGYFTAHPNWHLLFRRALAEYDPVALPRLRIADPKLWASVWIASGEKVMGAGELVELNRKHDKIRAGEMEGYGFASACEHAQPSVPWLVVRGISDHGDSTKDGVARGTGGVGVQANSAPTAEYTPIKDEYHVVAALSACAFLRTFLETGYRPVTPRRSGDAGSHESDEREYIGTLSDRRITAMATNGLLISENFDPGCVRQACYELRAGDIYYDLGAGKARRSAAEFGYILVKPRQLTVVITKESLEIPSDILGRILTKGRLFSVGILPVNTYADPGFQGRLGIVLYNATANFLRIRSGEAIAKIEFSKLAERVERPYVGQHGYQSEIWPIPEDVILSESELRKDARVEPPAVELERAYGPEIGKAHRHMARVEIVAWVAVLLAVLAVVLVLR